VVEYLRRGREARPLSLLFPLSCVWGIRSLSEVYSTGSAPVFHLCFHPCPPQKKNQGHNSSCPHSSVPHRPSLSLSLLTILPHHPTPFPLHKSAYNSSVREVGRKRTEIVGEQNNNGNNGRRRGDDWIAFSSFPVPSRDMSESS